MQAPHLRRTIRLYVLAAAIAATVALCVAAWDYSWGIVSPKLLNAVLTILLVGLVAELGAVSLNIGSASFSVAFIPYLAATYLFPTIWAMLVAAVAECAVETFVRKKPLIKIVFNTSKEVLALGLASSVYQLLGGIPTIEPTQRQDKGNRAHADSDGPSVQSCSLRDRQPEALEEMVRRRPAGRTLAMAAPK